MRVVLVKSESEIKLDGIKVEAVLEGVGNLKTLTLTDPSGNKGMIVAPYGVSVYIPEPAPKPPAEKLEVVNPETGHVAPVPRY